MITIKAPAKINLFLDVLGRRQDGYHNINSLLLPISLFDTLRLEGRPGKLSFHFSPLCRFAGIPWPFSMGNNADNLITRAARLFQKYTDCKKGAAIYLTKRIPIGAGLGGGSTDAAAVLRGLNLLWQTGLSTKELIQLGGRVGCDVPALIHGGTICTQGRGEIISLPFDAPFKRDFWILLVYPGMAVSTGDIYRRLDQYRRGRQPLITARNKYDLIKSGLESGSRSAVGKGLFNALQETVFHKYPLLEMIKNNLEKTGCKHVLLAGSGSTVFALLRTRREGEITAKMIRKRIAAPLWTRVVHTIKVCPMV